MVGKAFGAVGAGCRAPFPLRIVSEDVVALLRPAGREVEAVRLDVPEVERLQFRVVEVLGEGEIAADERGVADVSCFDTQFREARRLCFTRAMGSAARGVELLVREVRAARVEPVGDVA